MYAIIPSATILGARGHAVNVEVQLSSQLPGFDLLGSPDTSCREGKDRVRAALMSCGIEWPNTKKVTINLTPPMLRKFGPGLDLAMAIGLLVTFEVIAAEAVRGMAFLGELGLDGTIRKIPGVAPMVGVRGDSQWVVPVEAVEEARIATTGTVRGVERLDQVIAALTMVDSWPECPEVVNDYVEPTVPDLVDVRGQYQARLGLEVAAAGGHHLMLVGPPGAGKTMLAKRFTGLLPDLQPEVALETTMIHSAAGNPLPSGGLVLRPPFRAPHHTSSTASLVGGGSHGLCPGEISLAHGGVLFMDEMGQFNKEALDALRESFEQGYVMVGRVDGDRTPVPARFQLIGATNPCPCGGGGPGSCSCDMRVKHRYLSKLSGPFLDRFDLRIAVDRPKVAELFDGPPGEATAEVAARVRLAREAAIERGGALNAQISDRVVDRVAQLDQSGDKMLRSAVDQGKLTARGFYRVARVARTLADLAGETAAVISEEFVTAALTMRVKIGSEVEAVAA